MSLKITLESRTKQTCNVAKSLKMGETKFEVRRRECERATVPNRLRILWPFDKIFSHFFFIISLDRIYLYCKWVVCILHKMRWEKEEEEEERNRLLWWQNPKLNYACVVWCVRFAHEPVRDTTSRVRASPHPCTVRPVSRTIKCHHFFVKVILT